MKALAFAPGHISAFFEPVYYNQNPARSGSRGAGICLSLGAKSQVFVQNAVSQSIDVLINNKKTNAVVTNLAVKHLIGSSPLRISINTILDLPMGQGFGMSGAGALSSAIALAKVLNIPKENAVKASHYAEVELRTGLGDVLSSSFGGVEIRREAGLPPWGMIEHIPGTYDIVLCVIGKKIDTRKVLTDPLKINALGSYGRYCTKKILEKPSLEHLFFLSQKFTQEIGFADNKVLQAIKAANQYGMASMCMLGNSVFAVGDTTALCNTLTKFGKVYVCPIDKYGAQLLHH